MSDVREKLLELRKRALQKRTEGNRFLSDRESVVLLAHCLPQTNSLILAEALKQDLKTHPLYDAVANWCDPDNGIGKNFPLQILEVAERLLPVEK
jgi:hypothetical protein